MNYLTYICHVVHTVARSLAPNDPDGEAGDAEEDCDGHAEPDDQAEVGHHHTDAVRRQVGVTRATHAAPTAAAHLGRGD